MPPVAAAQGLRDAEGEVARAREREEARARGGAASVLFGSRPVAGPKDSPGRNAALAAGRRLGFARAPLPPELAVDVADPLAHSAGEVANSIWRRVGRERADGLWLR